MSLGETLLRPTSMMFRNLVSMDVEESIRANPIDALNVPEPGLELDVPAEELRRRRVGWQPPAPPARGYRQLHVDHVLQADRGADFDFLVGRRDVDVAPDNH